MFLRCVPSGDVLSVSGAGEPAYDEAGLDTAVRQGQGVDAMIKTAVKARRPKKVKGLLMRVQFIG